MTRNGGRLVVDSLLAEGVEKAFTVPGESFLPVLDALYDEADAIDVVSTRHEEGSGFAAEGYAKASGGVGVCMVTRGPGATNLSIALHTARQDSTPMVALVGQVPVSARYREAFQEVDLVRFFSPLVKWAIEIPQTDRIPELLQQAFRVARSERPGPVVVGLPEDVLFGEAEAGAPRPSIRLRAPRPAEEAVEEAYEALANATSPVVIAGREVLATGASAPTARLAEAFELPAMTAFRRFDAFPNRHPNYVGPISLGTPQEALEPLENADLVLALGTRFDETTTSDYRYPKPDSRILHVAASPEVAGVWGADTTPIVADVRSFVELLLARRERDPGARRDGARAAQVRRYRSTYERLSAFDEPAPGLAGTSISGVMRTLHECTPKDTALVTDAGNFAAWVPRYYPFEEAGTHFGPVSGAMGYGLPGAIGVALANPERTVVALAGDGGFAMTMSELALLKERRLPVVAIVFVNGLYGTIRMHQEKHYPNRRIATTLHNPSFAAIGEAYGLDAYRVEDNGQFERALRAAVAKRAPAVIEVMLGEERLTAWGNYRAPAGGAERS